MAGMEIMMDKKKLIRNLVIVLVGIAALGIYYYVTIPAINIHSTGTWKALLFLILVLMFLVLAKQFRKNHRTNVEGMEQFRFSLKDSSLSFKVLGVMLVVLCLVL